MAEKMTMQDHAAQLRKAAAEIRRDGHLGWGNACADAADAIDAHLSQPAQAVDVARRFHEAYERLAPSFGYETRPDTRAFDPESPNGKLMIAVCAELTRTIGNAQADGWRAPDSAVATFVEEAAKIISGAPFPSGRSLFKARQIADLAMTTLSPTPPQPEE